MNLRILLLLLPWLFACTKIEVEPENTPSENFEFVWNIINENFSLFDINGVRDWNEVYGEYAQQIGNNITDDSLFRVLNCMLLELKDRHTDINRAFQYFKPPVASNVDRATVNDNYLANGKQEEAIYYAILAENIGLARIESFGRKMSEEGMMRFVEAINETDGLIFDVRGNGGGDESNAAQIAEALHDKKRLYKTSYTKIGAGKDDFEKVADFYIKPWSRDIYDKPIVLLIDNQTYSSASNFVLMLRGLPNVTLMGVHSGGGHGFPVRAQMPNGWELDYSSSYALDVNGVQVENGVAPEIEVALDTLQLSNGIDNIIERAIDHLK